MTVVSMTTVPQFITGAFTGFMNGAGMQPVIGRVVQQGWVFAIVCSSPFVFALCFAEPIFKLFKQEADLSVIAGDYSQTLSWGLPAAALAAASSQFLTSVAMTLPVTIITFIGAGLGLALTYFLIHGILFPKMLAEKAFGHATSVQFWFNALAYMLYFGISKRFAPFNIYKRFPLQEAIGTFCELSK